jgi:hypothetical protein
MADFYLYFTVGSWADLADNQLPMAKNLQGMFFQYSPA